MANSSKQRYVLELIRFSTQHVSTYRDIGSILVSSPSNICFQDFIKNCKKKIDIKCNGVYNVDFIPQTGYQIFIRDKQSISKPAHTLVEVVDVEEDIIEDFVLDPKNETIVFMFHYKPKPAPNANIMEPKRKKRKIDNIYIKQEQYDNENNYSLNQNGNCNDVLNG
eukprot:163316_1